MDSKDPISLNIQGVQSLVGSRLNKTQEGAVNQLEGVEGEYIDEFTLLLSDDELLALSKKWTSKYAGYEEKIKIRQMANKTYYLGRQKEGSMWATTEGQPIGSNLLFEAEETFLPAALSKNPEPVVWADNTDAGKELSNQVKTMLQYHADTLVLRRKLTLMTRHWSIYFIGVAKHGWDDDIKEITTEIRDPRNFIFDPDGFVDNYADYVGYLGERITVTADKLIDLFPKHKGYITIMVNGQLGTDVTYTEWWNDEYCFYTFKEKVLEKSKNPHFNYPKKVDSVEDDQTLQGVQDEVINHFAKPKKPYTFLSVFSLGEQPHDVTGLIEQNIPNQRRVSRRTEQIDYNLSRANNSTIFSENNFNQETAKQASTGMAKGHPILVPSGGPISEAVHQLPGQGIDPSYFKELENSKQDLRSIFGTEGITATPPEPNDLATTRVLNQNHDGTRIGGGIGDAIEQVAKNIFNYWAQLYAVYYDVEHVGAIMGQMSAVEYATLKAQNLTQRLVISVSPDSMKPKDEVSEQAQAMQLFEAGALDPKTLCIRLNMPDPQKTAEQMTLWIVDKMTYMQINFPEIAQEVQQAQQQAALMMQQAQQAQIQNEGQQAQQQMQVEGQKAQMGMQQQGQQAQQGMAIKQATTEQTLRLKEAEHQQKLKHQEELNKAKVEQQKKAVKSPMQINRHKTEKK